MKRRRYRLIAASWRIFRSGGRGTMFHIVALRSGSGRLPLVAGMKLVPVISGAGTMNTASSPDVPSTRDQTYGEDPT